MGGKEGRNGGFVVAGGGVTTDGCGFDVATELLFFFFSKSPTLSRNTPT